MRCSEMGYKTDTLHQLAELGPNGYLVCCNKCGLKLRKDSLVLHSNSRATAPQKDLNHFYPWDPTLPPEGQGPGKNIPRPDAEELRRRELSRQYARPRPRY